MSDDKDRADTPEARQRFDEFADSSPVFTAMVREMARLIAATAGAVNYIEYGLHSQETGLLSVTIRTEHGETPGQQCARLATELAAQRARADRAITALREVRRLCAAFEVLEDGRSSAELLDAIHGAAIQALGDLQ